MRPAWLIAFGVGVPTFLAVLDSSVNNVVLIYIARRVSATQPHAQWLATPYLAANGIVLLLSDWLSNFFGRRRYFLGSLVLFTLGSFLCGFAQDMGTLILFRIVQGLGAGAMVPSCQDILLDAFPDNRRTAL